MSNVHIKLRKVSWDFPKADTRSLTHPYHPFHAKFIPQIPRVFITNLTKENHIVLDPFCGSGTTLVEANILGRHAIGVDISPLAVLISKVKTTYIDPIKLELAKKELRNKILTNKENKVIPEFPDKDVWYNAQTLEELGIIWGNILSYKEKNPDIFDFFRVAFSSILKTVANRSKHWNWTFIGDNILPKINRYIEPNKYFFRTINKMIKGMLEFKESKKNNWVKIFKKDTKKLSQFINTKVNLIITSPPYPFAVDFNRYYRLSYYWFDWQIDKNRDIEIGARSKRSKKNAVNEYFRDIQITLKELYKVLNDSGYFCLTLGNTHRNKEEIKVIDNIIEMSLNEGFKLIQHSYRELSQQSMPQKRIPREAVLIFNK